MFGNKQQKYKKKGVNRRETCLIAVFYPSLVTHGQDGNVGVSLLFAGWVAETYHFVPLMIFLLLCV
jgi:hypothetical protein